MTDNEKKFVLVSDLITANDNLGELGELIISLSKNQTATSYLLYAVKSECKQVLHCLKELERYGISDIEQAMLYFYDIKKKN